MQLTTAPSGRWPSTKPSWTDWQKQCFYGQLDYVLVINGDVQGGFGSAYGSIRGIDDGDWSSNTDIIGDIRILEQDIAEIKSFKLVLRAAELTEYNGVKVPHDGSITASYTPDGWNEDTSPVTFESFALDVPVK